MTMKTRRSLRLQADRAICRTGRARPDNLAASRIGTSAIRVDCAPIVNAPERRLAVVTVRDGWVVHPSDLVVGFGQRVESEHYDHRGGAHGPGGVTGAGASPTFCDQYPEPGAASRNVVRRELGDVVVVGSTTLGFDHGEQSVARIVDADVGNLPATWSWWMAQWLGRGCAAPNSSPVVSATRVPRISSSVAEVCSGRCARRTAWGGGPRPYVRREVLSPGPFRCFFATHEGHAAHRDSVDPNTRSSREFATRWNVFLNVGSGTNPRARTARSSSCCGARSVVGPAGWFIN